MEGQNNNLGGQLGEVDLEECELEFPSSFQGTNHFHGKVGQGFMASRTTLEAQRQQNKVNIWNYRFLVNVVIKVLFTNLKSLGYTVKLLAFQLFENFHQ